MVVQRGCVIKTTLCKGCTMRLHGEKIAVITIKDYAKDKGISYEAVRKQVKRYATDELKDHIVVQGRTQFLDEYAVDFLNQKRNESPIIIQEQSKDEELERLKEENKQLLIRIASLQDELLKEKEEVKILQTEKIHLLELKVEPEPESEPERKKKKWWKFW